MSELHPDVREAIERESRTAEPLRCVVVCSRNVTQGTTAITLERTDRTPFEPLVIDGRPVVVEFSTEIVEDLLHSKRFAERLIDIERRINAMESPMPRESLFPRVQGTPLGD